MLNREQLIERRGATLLDAEGDKAGTIEDIYLDRERTSRNGAARVGGSQDRLLR
jgi:hypothetical protein